MNDKIGPTGKFPDGQLSKDDEGELSIGIARRGDHVYINFGVPVDWLAMPLDQARSFAELILWHVGSFGGD